MWPNKLLLLFLILPALAQASVPRVNGSTGIFISGGAGSPTVATGSFSVSAGNLLVCNVQYYSVTAIASLSDTGGDIFSQVASNNAGIWAGTAQQWYAKNTALAGSEIVILTLSFNVGYLWINCSQYSGADTVNPLDASAVGSNTSQACGANAMTTGTFSTSFANEVIVAGFAIQFTTSTPDVGTGYTLEQSTSDYTLWQEDQQVSSLQSGIAATFGTSTCNFYYGIVGTYKQAGSIPTTSVKHHVRIDN